MHWQHRFDRVGLSAEGAPRPRRLRELRPWAQRHGSWPVPGLWR